MAEERLKKAQAQLVQVNALLEEEPSNPELLQLANDLREAICLAEALVSKQDLGPVSSKWQSIPTTTTHSTTPAASASASPTRLLEFLPNDHVELRQSATSKLWQGGVVQTRLPDYTYVCIRLCDAKEITVRGDGVLLRACQEPATLKLSGIALGMTLRARYSGDGKYYQASVTKTSPHGVWVKFEGYEDDEAEHVLLEHCRESEPGEAPSLLEMGEIPKHLLANANDSDEVRAKKQRQLKAWRRKQRDEQIDQVHAVKQDQWLSFQAATASSQSASASSSSSTWSQNKRMKWG